MAWKRFRTSDLPGVKPDEEVAINLDQIVMWKGRGKAEDSPLELYLSNGMHIRVELSHAEMEKAVDLAKTD
jgi:hypothetical protein